MAFLLFLSMCGKFRFYLSEWGLFCSYLWYSQLFKSGSSLSPIWSSPLSPPSHLSVVASLLFPNLVHGGFYGSQEGLRGSPLYKHKKIVVCTRCVSSNYREVNTSVCVQWKGWGIEMSADKKIWKNSPHIWGTLDRIGCKVKIFKERFLIKRASIRQMKRSFSICMTLPTTYCIHSFVTV
jgi:hypothetical protein